MKGTHHQRECFPCYRKNNEEYYMSSGTFKLNIKCINWIRTNIEKGSSILEFGSGPGSTGLLAEDYDLHSIEEKPRVCR